MILRLVLLVILSLASITMVWSFLVIVDLLSVMVSDKSTYTIVTVDNPLSFLYVKPYVVVGGMVVWQIILYHMFKNK